MSFRSWLFVAAVGLTLLPVSGQSQEKAGKAQNEAAASGEQPGGLSFAIPIEIIESDAEADARQREEDEAQQREVADLAAQQGMHLATEAMNDATQRMADYAFWSTLIVGVGTVLLLWTLWETRKANKSANRSVDMNGEMFRRQLRAYVTVPPEVGIFFECGHKCLSVTIPFRNVGSIPASDLVFNGTVYVHRIGEVLSFCKIVDEHGGLAPTAQCGFNAELPRSSPEDREKWGTVRVSAVGKLYYKNGFSERCHSGVAMWAEMESSYLQKNGYHYYPVGNAMT